VITLLTARTLARTLLFMMKLIIRDYKGYELNGKRWAVVQVYGYRESLIGFFETREEAINYRAACLQFA